MMKKKDCIILLVISVVLWIALTIIICVLNETAPSVEVRKRTKIFPNKTFIYDWQSLEHGRVVYLVCDDTFSKCKLEQIKYPYTSTAHSCNITLVADGTAHRPHDVLVMPFGEDRAILLREDDGEREGNRTSVKISVVHLNECRQTEELILSRNSDLTVRQLSEARRIVINFDHFDIFGKDSKLTVSDEARVINVEIMNNGGYNISNINSVAARSPVKGYVYTKYDSKAKDNGLFFMPPNGTENRLKSMGTSFEISIVNLTIGVCSQTTQDYPNITCSHYNADGKLKFNFLYKPILRPYANASNSSFGNIYTLPNEGFLLQFFEFEKCQNNSNCETPATLGYYIVKVDASGKEVGKFYRKEYDDHFGRNEIRHIWKNEGKGAYCTLVLSSSSGRDTFDLTSTCFTNAVFSR